MPKIAYIQKRFSGAVQAIIDQANGILEEYAAQGYTLSLRQVYYQFVARGWLANTQQSYKRLGDIISDARLAGLIDWNHLEDRTRNVRENSHWSGPAEIVQACADQFRIDTWAGQPRRIIVLIEKDALAGVFEPICRELDVPFLSCRGYTSQSEMWSLGQRIRAWKKARQKPMVLHFGDHDPSGIDMTRDIAERLRLFSGPLDVKRVALNMDQIEEHQPPPNPAKTTDARFQSYQEAYGDESWELDALEPALLAGLVRAEVEALWDEGLRHEATERQETMRSQLREVASTWPA